MSTALQPRARRFDLSFPLQFREDAAVVKGHCLNLSESGLLGVFDQPLEVWTSGTLLLQFAGEVLELAARVARAEEHEAGLAFVYRREEERAQLSSLLARAAQTTLLVGRPPF